MLHVFCCDYTETGRILFCGESIDEFDGVDIPPRPTGMLNVCRDVVMYVSICVRRYVCIYVCVGGTSICLRKYLCMYIHGWMCVCVYVWIDVRILPAPSVLNTN